MSNNINTDYKLLPFNFSRVAGREVLVNALGDLVVAPEGTIVAIVNRQGMDSELYKTLVSNFFIYEGTLPTILDIYANRLRIKKGFLDTFTSLHIFVLTLKCNQNCVYCQASSRGEDSKSCTMSKKTMASSVAMMFKSPSPYLTMEFQGGEPSLELELIKYGIEEAERLNKTAQREITYVLCTNCINLSDNILCLCKDYKIQISTSLDGPSFIHNANRGKNDSYNKVVKGIEKAREVVGHQNVNALLTTSKLGVNYPHEIIDEYVKLGFKNLFLRALNPYGLAISNDNNWNIYNQQFIAFYKQAFEYILKLNQSGVFFVEEFAAIILRKILTPFTTGFVDLQSPAGIINSVLVYNYDGYVYASDESRMLAEYNDYTFRLGKVTDNYKDIVYGEKTQSLAKIWSNETLAGCSDCAYLVYCGADPVRNYSTQGDAYGNRASSWLCDKNRAIIEYLITLLIERKDEVMPIFKTWLG